MLNVKDRCINVLIRADAKQPYGVKFDMPGEDLIFENQKHDGFMVYFNILDPDATGYRFPDDLEEALWVTEIAAHEPDRCPEEPDTWDQFFAKEVMNDNMTLRVRNRNKRAKRFGFTLRFTKKPAANGPCIPYDPIGDNRNGPTSALTTLAAAAVGVVAIGTAALIAFNTFDGRD